MTAPQISPPWLYALAGVLGLAGCGAADDPSRALTASTANPQAVPSVSSKVITIPFHAANFVTRKDNLYFPLHPGTRYTYRSEFKKEGPELNVVNVTHQTKTILGVSAIVVHDQVFIEDGSLSEDTFDWFAPDKDGNVWYLGEDTKTFDHGKFLTDEGSWEAGKNGAKAGIIMLADPHVGDIVQQENSPGVVEDMGKVIRLTETVTVPFGTFTNCLETTEWTPIEPGDRSHKFYAPGIGNVLEVATRQGGERDELINLK